MPGPPLPDLLAAWGALWGLEGLEERLTVRFSRRMTRSLGCCRPASGRISLHAGLAGHPGLAEVLCHEAAHYACWQLHGPAVRPHGPEWADLVRRAGYTPSTRLDLGLPSPAPRARRRYLHRCPICRLARAAGRPVRAWRCRRCLEAGRDGQLTIEALA